MVFKRFMQALGVGGPAVETVLVNPNCRPGGYLEGQIHVVGGDHPVEIEYVALGLVTRVEVESGDSDYDTTQEFHRPAGHRRLPAGQRAAPRRSVPLPGAVGDTRHRGVRAAPARHDDGPAYGA